MKDRPNPESGYIDGRKKYFNSTNLIFVLFAMGFIFFFLIAIDGNVRHGGELERLNFYSEYYDLDKSGVKDFQCLEGQLYYIPEDANGRLTKYEPVISC